MKSILDDFQDLESNAFEAGEILLEEGASTGRLIVLCEGTVVVVRAEPSGGEIDIATVSEAGAIFGEMAMLLGLPHTASVRTVTPVRAFVVDHAVSFLQARPEIALPVAKLLARRLHAATNYLVNLKQQFQDFDNHFGMVDEVLESLTHQQDEDFTPVDELPRDPRL